MSKDWSPSARHQAAVTSFTLFALASRRISATIERGVHTVAEALGAPVGALVKVTGAGRASLVLGRGRVALTPGEAFDVDPEALTQPVSHEPMPWGALCGGEVGDESGRPRRTPTSLSVVVLVEGTPWGRLIVCDDGPRVFSGADVQLMQMVAAVLSAALELERAGNGQGALADFGRDALQSRDVTTTIEQAVDVVRRVLATPVGALVRPRADRPTRLVLVHAAGTAELVAGYEYDIDPRLGGALLTGESLVIEDSRYDQRFRTPLLPRPDGTIAYLAAPVLVDGRTWGRLVASDTRPRRFSEREVDAAESVANVLAAALQRKRQEWARVDAALLSPSGERRSAVQDTEVALLDRSGVIVWVNQAWEDFCLANGGDLTRAGVGVDYLACCDAADDAMSDEVAAAIRAALSGDLPAPMTLVVPCHSPDQGRWYDLLISPRFDRFGTRVGAAVTFSPAVW